MKALFITDESATVYRDACNIAEGLPKAGIPEAEYPYGWTLSWSNIVEVDGKWPVEVHPKVPVPEGVEVIAEEPIL